MASKGKINDIIDLRAVEQQKAELIKALDEIFSKMEKMSKGVISLGVEFKGAEKISELTEAEKKLAVVNEDVQKLLVKEAQLRGQLDSLRNGEAKQLAITTEQLKKKKSELQAEAKLSEASAGSIQKMRLELSRLKKAWAETGSGAERNQLAAQIKTLNDEVLQAEKSIDVFGRQVGNYELVSEKLTTEIRSATEQLAQMKIAGLDGSEAYEQLREKAGAMQDAMEDARREVKNFASDTAKLDQLISVSEGLAGGFAVAQSATALLGVENEELQATFVKLQAAMSLINGLKAIQNTLQKESAAYTLAENFNKKISIGLTWAQNKAETGGIVTRKLATAAQWALNAAMKANPIGLLLAGIVALIAVGALLFKIFSKNTDTTKQYNAAIDQSKKSVETLNKELDRNVKMMEAQGESQQAIISAKLKAANEELAIQQKLQDDLRSMGGDLTDDQIQQLKDAQEAEKEAWSKIIALHDDAGALQVKLQQQYQNARLQNMKDGLNKEMAIINADYAEKIKAAEGHSGLVQQLEIERENKIAEARKKYAIDYIKAEKETIAKLNESRIALLSDGFEKEIATLRQSYQQQIAEIEERLKNETTLTTEQRKRLKEVIVNLRKQQSQDEEKIIAENEIKALKNQEMYIALRLQGEEEGTAEAFDLKQRMLQKQREIELLEAEKTGIDKALINAKYDKLIADQTIAATTATLDLQTETAIFGAEKKKQAEISALRASLQAGEITIEQYEQQSQAIEQKYSTESIRLAINEASKKLEVLKSLGADTTDAERQLFNLKKSLSDQETSNFIDNEKKKADAAAEVNAMMEQAAMEFANTAISITNSTFDAKKIRLDEEAAQDQANKERELAAAAGNAGMIDEINRKYDQKEKARENERRRIELQQAKFQKAAAVAQAIINTALAITKVSPNPPLMALAASIGAMQVAAIVAQPLPKYRTGREGGKAEWAVVGEAGHEMIELPGGEQFITPPRPTVTWLPDRARVIPNHELMQNLAAMTMIPTDTVTRSGMVAYDLNELKQEIASLKQGFEMVASTIRNKKELHINITERGLQAAARRGNSFTEYLNQNVRL